MKTKLWYAVLCVFSAALSCGNAQTTPVLSENFNEPGLNSANLLDESSVSYLRVPTSPSQGSVVVGSSTMNTSGQSVTLSSPKGSGASAPSAWTGVSFVDFEAGSVFKFSMDINASQWNRNSGVLILMGTSDKALFQPAALSGTEDDGRAMIKNQSSLALRLYGDATNNKAAIQDLDGSPSWSTPSGGFSTSLSANTTYDLSFYVNLSQEQIQIDGIDLNSMSILMYIDGEYEASLRVCMNREDVNALQILTFGRNSAAGLPGVVQLDNIQVSTIPEPALAGLLAGLIIACSLICKSRRRNRQ